MKLVYLLLFVYCIIPAHAESTETTLRFGLTSVIPTENLRFIDQWSDYLESKTGHKIEFVLRKSYQEVMDLLDSGSIEFAWICGYPYIQKREPESIKLLVVPVYRGEPRYRSYIIVHENSPYKSLSDLKGKVFAFSDPDSNSGFLYPLYLMAEKDEKPDTFFRQTFFTFNHAETIQAVAEQVADAGAVDSYIWEYLAINRPDITQKTRIIKESQSFGFPPIVSRLGVNDRTVMLMRTTLQNMNNDDNGKSLLSQLKLDAFANFPDSLYNDIRAMDIATRQTSLKSPTPTTD